MSKNKQFKDFITLQRGFDLPNSNRSGGEIPVVASTGISGYHNEYKVKAPGVVTGRSGSLGTVQYITQNFWPLNTSLWVKDFKGNSPKYVYYYLQTMQLEQYNSGAGVPTLNRNDLDAVDIKVHGYEVQCKIVSILSTYDKLIENNNRRIAILEEMAQKLYREWFVHFRFPGHENVKMVESEMGMIPEGWEVRKLGTVVDNFDSKRKPISTLKRKSMQGKYPYFGAAKVIDYVNDYIFDDTFLLMAEDGSVITTENTPMLQYVRGKIWVNNHTHILQGKAVSTEFLLLNLSRFDIRGYITGAAQPKITQENLNRIPILVPPNDILKTFDIFTQKAFDEKIILENKNTNLRKTRDLLLPRLISGDIDVSELDIPTKEG